MGSGSPFLSWGVSGNLRYLGTTGEEVSFESLCRHEHLVVTHSFCRDQRRTNKRKNRLSRSSIDLRHTYKLLETYVIKETPTVLQTWIFGVKIQWYFRCNTSQKDSRRSLCFFKGTAGTRVSRKSRLLLSLYPKHLDFIPSLYDVLREYIP